MIFIHFLTHRPSGIGWQPWRPLPLSRCPQGQVLGHLWGRCGGAVAGKPPLKRPQMYLTLGFSIRGGLRPRIWMSRAAQGTETPQANTQDSLGTLLSSCLPGHFPGLCRWKAVASACEGGPGVTLAPGEEPPGLKGPRGGGSRGATASFTCEDCPGTPCLSYPLSGLGCPPCYFQLLDDVFHP